MKKKDLENYLTYLTEKEREYLLAKNAKDEAGMKRIRGFVKSFAERMDDSVYIECAKGSASGLFDFGFFESDMYSSIDTIRTLLQEAEE